MPEPQPVQVSGVPSRSKDLPRHEYGTIGGEDHVGNDPSAIPIGVGPRSKHQVSGN